MRSLIDCGWAEWDQKTTKSQISWMRWMRTLDMIRFAFGMLLLPWNWWEVLEMKQWSGLRRWISGKSEFSKWCSQGCKKWAPSLWARRPSCAPCCGWQESARYSAHWGTELGGAAHCFLPQIQPEITNKPLISFFKKPQCCSKLCSKLSLLMR